MLNLNEFRIYISNHLPAVSIPDFPGSEHFMVTQYFDKYSETNGQLQREIVFHLMYKQAVQLRLLNNLIQVDFDGASQPVFNEADLDTMTPEQVLALDAQCGPFPYLLGLYTITERETKLAIENTAKLKVDLSVLGFLERVSRNDDGTFRLNTGSDAALVIPVIETTNRLIFSSVNGITAETFDNTEIGFSLPLCRIKGTEAVIQVNRARFKGSLQAPEMLVDEAFLEFGKSVFDLGAGLGAVLPKIAAKDIRISKEGMSGSFSAKWPLEFDQATGAIRYKIAGETTPRDAVFLGGLKGGLESLEFSFEKNKLIKGSAKGKLVVPYFETPVDIRLEFNEKFEPKLVIDALNSDGLVIEKKNLLKLQLKQFTFDGQNKKIGLSGALEPLLFAAEGMKWPKMDVKDLFIDSKGKLSIKEAWMDMKGTAALDFYGFSGEIKKVGFGMEGDQMWFSFSGGMKLIDFLPIKGDVEECRFKWPETLDLGNPSTVINELKKIQVQFSGVNVDFEIPKTLSIKGNARLIKEPNKVGFGGDMILDVPTAGFKAEAGLLVGMNFEMPAYAFFMTYFGFELAAGIPLGQSGLALKGALGMLGINVEPDRNPDQNWYADWYKRGPIPGAHQTNKWRDVRNAFALGIGVTITSADGFVKGTRGLLVLAVPGPILILEGRALLLEGLPASNKKEPPLRALAIFDGKEQIAQFNIEAQAEIIADTLDASGELEAFFDFKDITNWHIFLGIDEPKSRRIKANVLNVVRADAYLMFDMNENGGLRTRLGASTVVEPPIPSPKVKVLGQEIGIDITARLSIDGKGEISMLPDQFSGGLDIDGELSISALGLEASVIMEADMKASGPQPFSMSADFKAQLNLPDGLPDFNFEHNFQYTLPTVNTIKLEPPLAEVSLVNRFKTHAPTASVRMLPTGQSVNTLTEAGDARRSPTVELDSFPVLAFSRDMNHGSGINNLNMLRHPSVPQKYRIGEVDVTPEVVSIQIFSKSKSTSFATTAWTLEFNSAGTPGRPLIGAWALESDPSSSGRPPYKKLQLLTPNPVMHTMHSMEMAGGLFGASKPASEHLSRRQLNEHKDFLFGPVLTAPINYCVDFFTETDLAFIGGSNWSYAGLHFYSPQRFEVREGCLRATDSLTIAFDRPVSHVEIILCRPLSSFKAEFCDIPAPDDKGNYPAGSQPGLANPDFFYLCTGTSIGFKPVDAAQTVFNLRNPTPFQQVRIQGNFMDIAKICPVYADEPAISDPGYANATLPAAPEAARLFKPGHYYKIEIKTRQAARVYRNRPLYNLYKQALNLTDNNEIRTEDYTHIAYYQTEGPPTNLSAYLKASYPEKGASGILANSLAQIVFKRNYFNIALSGSSCPEYAAMPILKNDEGESWHLPFGFNLQSHTSFFLDEEEWQAALQRRGKTLGLPKDMGLSIQLHRVGMLPGKKYTLMLGGGSGGEEIAATGFGNEDEVKQQWNVLNAFRVSPGNGSNVHAQIQLAAGQAASVCTSKRQDLTDTDLAFDFTPDQFSNHYFNIRWLINGLNRLELELRWNPVATNSNSTRATLKDSKLLLFSNSNIPQTFPLPESIQFNLFKTGAEQKNRIRLIHLGGRLHVFVNYNRIWTLDLHCGKVFSSTRVISGTGDHTFAIQGNPVSGAAVIPEGWNIGLPIDIMNGNNLIMAGNIKAKTVNSITVAVEKTLQQLTTSNWTLRTKGMLPDAVRGWAGSVGFASIANSTAFSISNISLRRAASIEIPFTTDRSGTIAGIAASGPARMQLENAAIPTGALVNAALEGFNSYRILEHDVIDIERDAEFRQAKREPGMTGTEAIDAVRNRMNEQLRASEAAFKALIDAMNPELLLYPVPEKVSVSALKDTASNRLLGFWMQFPNGMDAASGPVTRHGRTTNLGRFRIANVNRFLSTTTVSPVTYRSIWKPDSSCVLILFNTPVSFTAETLGTLRFWIGMDRFLNHGDSTAPIPHRYDRLALTVGSSDTGNLIVEF